MEQFIQLAARDDLAVTIFPFVQNQNAYLGPFSGAQFKTAGE
jgi:hypothetical protein